MSNEDFERRYKLLFDKVARMRKAQKQCDRFKYPTSTDRNAKYRTEKDVDGLIEEENQRLNSPQKEMF